MKSNEQNTIQELIRQAALLLSETSELLRLADCLSKTDAPDIAQLSEAAERMDRITARLNEYEEKAQKM